MRDFSWNVFTFSRSKERGWPTFCANQSARVCGRWRNPKSRRWTGLLPHSDSSTPIGLAFSNPGIAWQE